MYRVALILAVLAAIGSLALSFTVTKPKIEGLVQERTDLQTNLAATEAAKTEAEKKAKAATATAEKKTAELAATQKDLEAATATAATQQARADKYFADYNKTLAEKNAAQEQLAQWAGTGLKPDQIIAMKADLKASKELAGVLADEKSILQRNVASEEQALQIRRRKPRRRHAWPEGFGRGGGSEMGVRGSQRRLPAGCFGGWFADGAPRRQARGQGEDRVGGVESERCQRAPRLEAG